jgi:hypothetical protein
MIYLSWMCVFSFHKIIQYKNVLLFSSKILELEEELKVVGNNMKSLEVSEQEVDF